MEWEWRDYKKVVNKKIKGKEGDMLYDFLAITYVPRKHIKKRNYKKIFSDVSFDDAFPTSMSVFNNLFK